MGIPNLAHQQVSPQLHVNHAFKHFTVIKSPRDPLALPLTIYL